MFQTKFAEKIKTHIFCSRTFLENCAIYEMRWENIVEPNRPQMTIWHIPIACWIPEAKTLSEYVILSAVLLQQLLHKHASMLHYTYIACLVFADMVVVVVVLVVVVVVVLLLLLLLLLLSS